MKKLGRASAALLILGLMSGCETADMRSGSDGVAVTRFHLGQPVARGEIRVEPADPARANSLEFGQQAAAVERELSRLGWNVQRANPRSEQVALIYLQQGSREVMAQRSSVSIGVGGGTGGWGRSGGGVGVGASIPLGGRGANEVIVSELGVRMQRRSDATVLWEGRAEVAARSNAPLAQPLAAADRLAAALFQDFPGESGRTIRVR